DQAWALGAWAGQHRTRRGGCPAWDPASGRAWGPAWDRAWELRQPASTQPACSSAEDPASVLVSGPASARAWELAPPALRASGPAWDRAWGQPWRPWPAERRRHPCSPPTWRMRHAVGAPPGPPRWRTPT